MIDCQEIVNRKSAIVNRTFLASTAYSMQRTTVMFTFLLWCLLFVLCWPVAIAALILYPIVWVLSLPFRLVGIAVHGVLGLVWAAVMFPVWLLSAPFRLGHAR